MVCPHHHFLGLENASNVQIPPKRLLFLSARITGTFSTCPPPWLIHPEVDSSWPMVYVLKWTISLYCATVIFHQGF